MTDRFNYLAPYQLQTLRETAEPVGRAFDSLGTYQVGSSLLRADYRDVDVRVILSDERFAAIFGPDLDQYPGRSSSLWMSLTTLYSAEMSRRTGMIVDCQFQSSSQASRHDGPRDALILPAPTSDAASSGREASTGVLQDELRPLLDLLGLPSGASDLSPHEMFQSALMVLRLRLAEDSPLAGSPGTGVPPATSTTEPAADGTACAEAALNRVFGSNHDRAGRINARDVAFSAWQRGRRGENAEDGGPCDWNNDTLPMVDAAIESLRAELRTAFDAAVAARDATITSLRASLVTVERDHLLRWADLLSSGADCADASSISLAYSSIAQVFRRRAAAAVKTEGA